MKYSIFLLVFVFVCGVIFSQSVSAQKTIDRNEAFRLLNQGKASDALPLFEKLAADNPNDRDIIEAYGLLLFAKVVTLKDPEERSQLRLKAKPVLQKALALGSTSQLLKIALDSIRPDGSDPSENFSPKKEIDELMREGETAFGERNYQKAREKYQKAFVLDPQLYNAALFIGDTYFVTDKTKDAGEWFAKAIAIDPYRETAYRYWADALIKAGKMDEAQDKAIEAIIAQPFSNLAYNGLARWAQTKNVKITQPTVSTDIINELKKIKQSDIDPSLIEKGKSVAIISFALTNIAKTALVDSKAGKKLDDSLSNLVKLHEAGLIQPYVFFVVVNRWTNDTLNEYRDYQSKNSETLKKYWVYIIKESN